MQLMSSRLSWGTKKQPSPLARPLGIVLTFLALGLGLLAATGPYKTASAHSIFSDWQPVGTAQAAACVSPGTQQPVTPNGDPLRINIVGGNPEPTPIHQLTLTNGGALVNNFCLDLDKRILVETYCEEGSTTTPELVYLINTYPPILTDRIAQAARQAAVWHLTNGANLQNPDSTDGDTATDALVLQANHPSPLSASRPPVPFIGCGHFGIAQRWLAARGVRVLLA